VQRTSMRSLRADAFLVDSRACVCQTRQRHCGWARRHRHRAAAGR
jgi:hypothetical protein